jgi:hypothetical protein
LGVYAYRKVVGVFVRFRAPLQLDRCGDCSPWEKLGAKLDRAFQRTGCKKTIQPIPAQIN